MLINSNIKLSKLAEAMETCNDDELKKKFLTQKIRAETSKKIMFMDLIDFVLKSSIFLISHVSFNFLKFFL